MTWIKQRTAEYRMTNDERWIRFAKSFFKTDRIHSFDVRCWTFDVRCSSVSFSIKPAAFQACGAARMKLNCEQYLTAERKARRDFLKIFSRRSLRALRWTVMFLSWSDWPFFGRQLGWHLAFLKTRCQIKRDKGLNHRRPDAITFLKRKKFKFEILCYQTNIPNWQS